MAWFKDLKEKGFFDPEKNPEPIEVGGNIEFPSWEVLDYLVNVANSFKNNQNTELIPDVLEIIKNVSENPVDNYRTWYKLIEILSLIPNNDIPIEFLDYIPTWVKSKFDTMLQTMEILNKLLKNFLDDHDNKHSIEKAERILFYLFEIDYVDNNKEDYFENKVIYKSPFYLYYINHALNDLGMLKQIAEYCTIDPLIRLSESINVLLRDHPILVQENIDDVIYKFKIIRILDTFHFELEIKDSNGLLTDRINKTDYILLDNSWIEGELQFLFNKHNIPLDIFSPVLNKLKFNLQTDIPSLMGYDGIKELGNDNYHDSELLSLFSYILREWLTNLQAFNKEDTFRIIESYITEQKFNLPFFKRMSIYIIAEDWVNLKSLFWFLIDKKDEKNIFSGYAYRLELYYLLQKVAKDIDEENMKLLSEIIEEGPKGDSHYSESKEEWQHRWLHALKDNQYFNVKFNELSNSGEFQEDYSEDGKITVQVGNISPYSVRELLEMDDDELVETVFSFKGNHRWDGPTVEGLSENLGKAVEEAPLRFSNIIGKFDNAGYLYVYHVINGLTNAWKDNKDFNWSNVLSFCKRYITTSAFENNELFVENDLRADKSWIYSNISSLIYAGCQREEHSFGNNLLPFAKDIVIEMLTKLHYQDLKHGPKTDFILHCLNSINGRVLQALINYALKYARTITGNKSESKWDVDARESFEKAMEDNVTETFILLGMYLSQFMFIDEAWLKERISNISNQSEINWMAFMGGLGYRQPLNKEYFNLLSSSYKRAADSGNIDLHYHQGILRHFLAYYFWDFQRDFEQSFLYTALKNSDVNLLKSMITLLNHQSKFINKESSEQKAILEEKAIRIWKLINERLKGITEKEDLKSLEGIVYFTDYIDSINDNNIELVEDNLKTFDFIIGQYHLLPTLLRWAKNSSPELIGRLIRKLKIKYIQDFESLSSLTEFMYENNQLEIANTIVNTLSMKGNDILRPLYLKYNK